MKKFLSVVLALVMTMSLVTITAGAKDFTDKSKISYKEAVDVISACKVIDGYTDGSFNPSATLTRGAAAKIICNLILGPTTGSSLSADAAPFKDVPVSNVFAGYIAYCSQQKIINGYADGTFKPAGTVTGYQFLKMLLGALGYSSANEGFTGANWSVNVAKLASSLSLTKSNDSFVGSAAMTREEACLYAFNTLKATMVEYDTNGTSITVGGTTISTAASKATEVKNTASVETIKNDDLMQFAEKYFKDLKKTSDTDAFERPATTWRYKTTDVGTYADKADASYTKKVQLGTIYSDLGLSKGIAAANVTAYTDGSSTAFTNDIAKGSTTKIGGNGVLTEVYYDADNGTATIVAINTYVGKISATYAASSTKDAYVTFASKTGGGGSSYETNDSYAVNDYVLYTYSNKSGDSGVKSMAEAQVVTGTLTAYTVQDSITVAGTKYDANAVTASKNSIASTLSNAMKTDVTVYVDSYGYAAYVDAAAASDNYAVVLGYTGIGAVGTDATRNVTLLFADGTTKTVTAASDSDTFNDNPANDAANIDLYDIVSYRINSDNQYKLEVLSEAHTMNGTDAGVNTSTAIVSKGNSITGTLTYGENGSTHTIAAANSKTVVLVKNGNTYSTYTGIANIPTVSIAGVASAAPVKSTTVTTYVKSGASVASLIFIVQNSDTSVASNSKDVIYVKGNSNGISHDADLGDYYSYKAIINGEVTTINTDASSQFTAGTLVTGMSKNSKNVYSVQAGTTKQVSIVAAVGNATTVDTLTSTVGTDTAENGSITLGTSTVSIANDCKVFVISADGNDMSESSISAIGLDSNNKVLYKMTDNEVSTIVIVTVDEANGNVNTPATAVTATVNTLTGTISVSGTYAAASTTNILKMAEAQNAIAVALNNAGYTVTSWNLSAPVAANDTVIAVAGGLSSNTPRTFTVTANTAA